SSRSCSPRSISLACWPARAGSPIDPGELPAEIAGLVPEERRQLLGLLSKHRQTEAQRLFYRLFPDRDAEWTGPSLMGGLVAPGQIIHARDKYPKHLEFFAASATRREICFMAANRVGKTFSG